VVFGADRGVTVYRVVETAAIQIADGRIDYGQIMAPSITVGGADHTEWGLNSDQARERWPR
jgi:hypothetical protein